MIRIIKSKALERVALDTTNVVVKKLSQWTNTKANINVLVADIVPLRTADQQIAVSEDYLTFYIEIKSRFSSGVSFIFLKKQDAMKLIDILNQQKPGTTKEIDEMGISALKETTNLIAGVYINEFVKIAGKDLAYTQPEFLTKKEVKNLKSKVLKSVKDKEVIMFQSGIDIKAGISVNLFLLLEKSLFRKLLNHNGNWGVKYDNGCLQIRQIPRCSKWSR